MEGITIHRSIKVVVSSDAVARAVAGVISAELGLTVDATEVSFLDGGSAVFRSETTDPEASPPLVVDEPLSPEEMATLHEYLISDDNRPMTREEFEQVRSAAAERVNFLCDVGHEVDPDFADLPLASDEILDTPTPAQDEPAAPSEPIAATLTADEPQTPPAASTEALRADPISEDDDAKDLTADQVHHDPVVTRKPKATAPIVPNEADRPDESGWSLREDAALAKFALQGMNEGGISRQPPLTRRRTAEIRARLTQLRADFGDIKEAAKALNRMVAEIDAGAPVA